MTSMLDWLKENKAVVVFENDDVLVAVDGVGGFGTNQNPTIALEDAITSWKVSSNVIGEEDVVYDGEEDEIHHRDTIRVLVPSVPSESEKKSA